MAKPLGLFLLQDALETEALLDYKDHRAVVKLTIAVNQLAAIVICLAGDLAVRNGATPSEIEEIAKNP